MVKKSLAVAMGAMLLAGSAAAVEVNPGAKGDLLLAPMFLVKNGWKSEFKVINTSVTDSAVAKVVFHAPGRSDEVLDFLIFLSPGDVWTGNVVENADGTVGVSSTDASSITVSQSGACPSAAGTTGFDSNVAKFTIPVVAGYANIFQAKMIRGLAPEADGTVSKARILKAYADECSSPNRADITPADTDNVLTGSVTMSNPLNGNKLTLGMTALADFDNFNYLTVGGLTTFSNTGVGKKLVEDALWASNYTVPYNVSAGNLSYATVTFPTKETFDLSANTQFTPFLPAVNDIALDIGTRVPVGYDIRDEEEKRVGTVGCSFSPCTPNKTVSLPRELNIVAFIAGAGQSSADMVYTSGFSKGWANIAIANAVSTARSTVNYNNFGKAGSPALVTHIQWDVTGGSLQGTWQYAAKTAAPAAN